MCVSFIMEMIKDYPIYSITIDGQVINNKTKKKLKPFVNNGYYRINLYDSENSRKTLYLHRLIAETYIPNPNNKPEVNHIDGNKLNNSIDNLEWVDRIENSKHSYKYGLQKARRSKNNERHKSVLQIDLNGRLIKKWDCVMDIERELNLSSGGISNCCLGKNKTSYGFIWKYINN